MYLRGPNERGEGPLPAATGYYPSVENLGTFTVDIYAEDLLDFAGFQIELDLPSGCYVAYHNIPPANGMPYGDRMVTWNDVFLPVIG
ncbi:MAG: hypothetical protein HQ592_07050 [Planctomycetes bacterium]|nr:hypothetical protein [Planctomycetota bacterium]